MALASSVVGRADGPLLLLLLPPAERPPHSGTAACVPSGATAAASASGGGPGALLGGRQRRLPRRISLLGGHRVRRSLGLRGARSTKYVSVRRSVGPRGGLQNAPRGQQDDKLESSSPFWWPSGGARKTN